jgi:competence protein ComEC
MMPLFWIALAFVSGLLCAKVFALAWLVWLGICVFLLLLIIIGRKYLSQNWFFRNEGKVLRVWPLVLALFVALGGLRYSLQQPHWRESDIAWYNDTGMYTLTAVVSQSPDMREDATYLTVSMRELYDPATLTFHRVGGKALIRIAPGGDWQLGDVLHFNAAPKTPKEDEDFSYRDYLERFGIHTVIYYPGSVTRVGTGQAGWFAAALDSLQRKASRTIFDIFPQPEAGLMAGILLGNDKDLPESLKQAYRNTGTAHVIAISGFNMSVLAGLCMALFSRVLNKRVTMLVSSLVLVGYTLFVGASPSVIRAAVMAILAFGGQIIGRKHAGLNVLGLTAGVMTAFNPYLPWDASFQLTFAATLGLLLFADPMKVWLNNRLERRFSEQTAAKLTGPVCEYFLYSLAAQVMTLPVIALQFQRFSLTTLIANPLVLPVQSAILVGGMTATLVGMILPGMGRVLALPVWVLLAWSNDVSAWINRWHWGSIALSKTVSILLAIGVVIMVVLFTLREHLTRMLKKVNWLSISLTLMVVAAVIGSLLLRLPDGRLHMELIRAGDGTGIFLRAPDGATLLIDPGGSPNQLAAAVNQQISPWNFHVDAALLTNRNSVDDLESIYEKLPIHQAILTLPVHRISDDLVPVTLPAGMPVKQLEGSEVIQLDDGVTVTPIIEDGEHTALLIVYGNTRILIPGGINPEKLTSQPVGSLSVLILNREDIANLPATMWTNYGAQVILWNDVSLVPDPGWMGLDRYTEINITADGTGYALDCK